MTLLRNMNSLARMSLVVVVWVRDNVHAGDGEDVGENDQEEDVVVVVPEVAMPVVDSTGGSSWLQAIPTKDVHQRGDDEHENH